MRYGLKLFGSQKSEAIVHLGHTVFRLIPSISLLEISLILRALTILGS